MIPRVLSTWRPVQWGFFWLAIVQLAIAGAHAAIFLAVGGPLDGPVSIRKPIVFSQAFGLVSLSLAFVVYDLGLPARVVAPLGWFGILVSGLEVGLAALQYWRGVPSHFNYTTLTDGFIAGTMTSGALAFAAFLGVVCLLALRAEATGAAARDAVAYAVRLSLPLATFGLSVVGLVMLLNGGREWHGWDAFVASVRGFELGRYNAHPATATPGGDLMLVHALSTHVLQVLPLYGWWTARHDAPATAWRPKIRRATLVYGVLTAVATVMALG